jgi:Tol biopolymer transport system component
MNNPEQSNAIARISVSNNGTQANGQSGSISISDDGRFIPFESNASNLVPNDINGQTDTFIYDLLNKTVELITLAPDGTPANGSSGSASISGDGNFVTFASAADNLVAGDTNKQRDIFLYNRLTKTTQLVSVASNGTQADGLSLFSAINDDGRYVTFESTASNLVSGDTNGLSDIFLFDRVNQKTDRINVASNGTQGNGISTLGSISDDGNYITFTSEASNLVPNDNNGKSDVFVYDRQKNTVELITTGGNGNSTSGSISGNGLYIVYESEANNLVAGDTNGKKDIFIYDRVNKTTERVDVAADGTQSNGNSRDASISDDGRYVAFLSEANNLISGDAITDVGSDIFIRDRQQKTTKRLDFDSFPTLSGDAKSLVLNSSLDNLVAQDTNKTGDVFQVDLGKFAAMSHFTTEDVHRFYQYEKGFHFYTKDQKEIDYVKQKSVAGEFAYKYEAEKFSVLANNKDSFTGETLKGVKPVYRFFNTGTGAHLYTAEEKEKSYIQNNLSNYSFEGIKYYAFESAPVGIETIPVFRLLNTTSGSHLYTIDPKELNYIQENLPNFALENNGEAVYHVFEL